MPDGGETTTTGTGTGTATGTASTAGTQGGGRGNGAQGRGSRGNRGRARGPGNTGFQFKGELEDFGAVLGTREERPNAKDQFLTFEDKLKLYVMKEYTNPQDLMPVVRDLEDPWPVMERKKPEVQAGQDLSDFVTKQLLQEEIKQYMTRKTTLTSNLVKVFGVVWGQCSPGLQEAIKGATDAKTKMDDYDCLWLLEQAKLHSSGVDQTTNAYRNVWMAAKAFFTVHQFNNESVEDYHTRFLGILDTAELAGADVLDHECLAAGETSTTTTVKVEAGGTTKTTTATSIEVAREKFKAMVFIQGANNSQFEGLRSDLQNQAVLGHDNYPDTLAAAYRILTKYDPGPTATNTHNRVGYRADVAFTQEGGNRQLVAGVDGRKYPGIFCFGCGKEGHYVNQCPLASSTDTQLMQAHFGFSQRSGHTIPSSWILLDSCLTVSSVIDRSLVANLRDCEPDEVTRVYTNGGSLGYTQKGDLTLVPFEVYYNPSGIANILSLAAVIDKFRVTLDSDLERAMFVHLGNGISLKFIECTISRNCR